MKAVVRQTRAYLMQMFEQHGFHPRSDLGQNFLIDINIIESIVRSAELTTKDVVLEVGAGTGGMTTFMAVEAGEVISVEYDPRMYQLAQEQAGRFPNVTLLHMDALKNKNRIAPEVLATVESALAVEPGRRLKLVANLPYNIATPLISNLIATELPWDRIVVTVQLELAERMAAAPGIANYGSLAAWVQAQGKVKIIRRMPPEVFWPRPKVDSAVLQIVPDPEARARIVDREFYHDFIRKVFTQRRKLLRPVVCGLHSQKLTKAQVDECLEAEGDVIGARAEQLDVPKLVSLANRLHAAMASDGKS